MVRQALENSESFKIYQLLKRTGMRILYFVEKYFFPHQKSYSNILVSNSVFALWFP